MDVFHCANFFYKETPVLNFMEIRQTVLSLILVQTHVWTGVVAT